LSLQQFGKAEKHESHGDAGFQAKSKETKKLVVSHTMDFVHHTLLKSTVRCSIFILSWWICQVMICHFTLYALGIWELPRTDLE